MNKTEIKYILIACCTCKRPNMLSQSLKSVSELVVPKNIKIELLVVDNDPNASAKNLIEELNKDFVFKINYAVEEKRGISNARNRLLKEALNLGASHIALFDDDEVVDKNWLASHVSYYDKNPDAHVISGPTYNKFQKEYPSFIVNNNIFKSSTTKKTGLKRESCASGNVFFPTKIMSESNIYFDTSHVFMGGEDGEFFSRVANEGYSIVWNNDAVNYEMIGDERANIKWILNRSYYNGYSGYLLKCKNKCSLIYKLVMLLKIIPVLIANLLILPFALMIGTTLFFNVAGISCKTIGKLMAVIKSKPLNYYENICGN